MKKHPFTKTNSYQPGTKLGIIGGGQLAQMLVIEATQMGLEAHVLSEKDSDPAALVSKFWHQGLPSAEKDQIEFCRQMHLVTFESEFYGMSAFAQLEKMSTVQFFPSPHNLQILQHRFSQKNLLQKFQLKTANFLQVKTWQDLQTAADFFHHQFVLKKSQGGYDGYGTYYCRKKSDLQRLKDLLPGDFIAEEFIAFQRELAMILVRSRDGSFVSLPVTETKQSNSRCDWVFGPVAHPEMRSLQSKFRKLLEAENYVGALGVELFQTAVGLYVNELAPRVHNSGHYSQDALNFSQFALHLQAGLGKKLAPPKLRGKVFAMVNLLGSGQSKMIFPLHFSGNLHWYGKQDNREGRKMGHINYLGLNAKKTLQLALHERKQFQL